MSGPALLAGACGALVTSGLALAWYAFVSTPARPASGRLRRWAAPDRHRATTRRPVLYATAAAVAIVVWLVTGWPVGGAIAGLAVGGLPGLLRQFSAANPQIDRLEALQEWVRRASDVIAAGGGLEQTLIRSARTAPAPIRTEVQTLVARLQARWPTDRALLAFADDLDDGAGDLVVAALLLGAELRGPGLARVLTELAHGLSEEVTMRRKVDADRAKPRANARWLLLITLVASALAAANTDYIAPYGSHVGQLVLAAIAALIVGCLLWMRRLTATPPSPRFLRDTGQAGSDTSGGPAQAVAR